jgi:pyruvate dehydrogenase E2 component (dihydrolipoamide acetyltransferase)
MVDALEVPYDRARKATAKRLIASVTTKPQVTLHSSASMSKVSKALHTQQEVHDGRITITHMLARITTYSLETKGTVNGWVKDEVVNLSPVVNLGVAVQTERSLVTPVLLEANRISFIDFCLRLDDLIERARRGSLHPKELLDGTFTLTNLGSQRVGHFTPIISPPQLAILGVGRMTTVPHWNGVSWESSAEIPLSLTFDHAAIDGRPAASFLDHLISQLEDPPEPVWR